MASIDELIANSGKTDPKMWEAIGNLPDAYRKGQDFAYQQKLRNAFSDENGCLPRDTQGNVETSKMYERLMQAGGAPAIDAAGKLVDIGLTQDRIRFAPTAGQILRGAGNGASATPSNNPPSSDAPLISPSTSRGVPRPDAAGAQQGDSPKSLMSFISNWGVPDELAGPEMNILGGKLSQALGRRVDPNATLDANNPKVRGILGDWVRFAGSLSSYIAGSRLSFRFLQSSVPRRSSTGTGLAFATIGAGSHDLWEAGRRSRRGCAR
jgi:hypothetical protein